MTRQPRTAANRTVLTLTGLALTVGGLWAGTAHTARAARLPTPPTGAALLDHLAGLRTHPWWTPAVITTGILATTLLTLWFLSQLHVRHRSRIPLAAPGSTLHTRALEDALSKRATTIDGIARCHVRIRVRPRHHLDLRIHAGLDPHTPPAAVIDALDALTTEAAHAAAPHRIQARVRLSHRTHRPPHVH